MQTAAIPPKEDERLAALYACGVLDTEPEAHFDELVWLASYICDAPIAYISFVDLDRQWFKARVGMTMCQSSRAVSFCSHTILGDEPFIVPDASRDERFRDSPLVTEPPHVRFYAGTPLRTSQGHALGSLCVIDHKPRQLDKDQIKALKILGRQTIEMLETSSQISHLINACIGLRQIRESSATPSEVEA